MTDTQLFLLATVAVIVMCIVCTTAMVIWGKWGGDE